MQSYTYRGKWLIKIISKDASFAQRVLITGATTGGPVIDGVPGVSRIVDGSQWSLTIEHNDGTHGWQPNFSVVPTMLGDPTTKISQVIRSKDIDRPGDTNPNDLVISLEKIGPMFELTVRPYAVDAASLMMFADGIFIGINGLQYLGVEVKNTWGATFDNEILFDISNTGRATLLSFGIRVIDAWPPATLMATQQTMNGRSIVLPQLKVEEKTTVYFLVDASGAKKGKPIVEFVLHNTFGEIDATSSMRYNQRNIFIAEIAHDTETGISSINIPGGRATLKLTSFAIDLSMINKMCKNSYKKKNDKKGGVVADDLKQLLKEAKAGNCDQKLILRLIDALNECLDDKPCGCGDDPNNPGGKGWQRLCRPDVIWLPLKFEYTVEIDGGFTGQFGPLAFQDPWWKVLLLIIALVALLVAIIMAIVNEASGQGYGNVGDHPAKIGTVGASNRIITDAALIELDGSRPFVQQVLDAITGEPNASFIQHLDTLITIDPQIAFPSLADADVVGKHVYKSGSRTGLTHGIISSIAPFTQNRRKDDGTPDPDHPDLVFGRDQFRIGIDPAFSADQSNADGLFDDHGDSGSIVLSNEPDTLHQVVGLLHSTDGGTSPIQDVLEALNITLRTT